MMLKLSNETYVNPAFITDVSVGPGGTLTTSGLHSLLVILALAAPEWDEVGDSGLVTTTRRLDLTGLEAERFLEWIDDGNCVDLTKPAPSGDDSVG